MKYFVTGSIEASEGKLIIFFLINVCFMFLVIQQIRTSACVQQKRFKSKVNIQRPRPGHYERRKVELFVTPYISNPDTRKPLRERCTKNILKPTEKIDQPYDVIIAKECLNWLKTSNMVAIFHRNSIKMNKLFNLAVALKKENMYFKGYQNSILEIAVRNSIYEPLMELVLPRNYVNYFVFSPDTNVNKLSSILKTTPELILIAGILHGKLLHRNDFLSLGAVDLVTMQAGLVQVLRTAAGGNLNKQLTHHQSTLVTRLKQIGTKEDEPCDVKE